MYVCMYGMYTVPAATFQRKHTRTNHEKIAFTDSGKVLEHGHVLVNEEFVHRTE